MKDIEQEITLFMAKFSKTVNDIDEDFNKLSPEAKQVIRNDASKLLDGFSIANVLSLLSGQAQK